MNAELQSRCWACLPKEARMAARETYRLADREYKFHYGKRHAFETMFGKHNLTSDIEPEEMLMVDRKKVQEMNKRFLAYQKEPSLECDIDFYKGEQNALVLLFGDKCLSDKPSVKVEPKFKIGDKVKIKNEDIASVIDSIAKMPDGSFNYHLHHVEPSVRESDLDPYTEPETKEEIDDILYEKDGISLEDESKIDEIMEEKELGKEDNFPTKELNLCELLKSCEGEEFYSPMFGDVIFETITENVSEKIYLIRIKYSDYGSDNCSYTLESNGSGTKNGRCVLYPSRALYEKYPLDAYSAWMEWKEERKPRYKFEVYLSGYDNGVMMADIAVKEQFQFKTYEEIMQAAEAVRECLEKFHSEHGEN